MKKLALCLAAVAVLLAIQASADPAYRSFVYQGRLDRNGIAENATHNFTFRFYGVASGGAQVGTDIVVNGIPVQQGAFSCVVGPLNDTILNTDPLYVEVLVDGTNLNGNNTRQRIYPTLFASRARPDGEFIAEATSRIRGWLLVEGSDFRMGLSDGRSAGTNTNQRALVHESGDLLVLNYTGDFEGGTRIDGNTQVTGNLSAPNVTATSTVTATTVTAATVTASGTVSGAQVTVASKAAINADENLRMVRGTINVDGSNLIGNQVSASTSPPPGGNGFVGPGIWYVTFNTAFTGSPSVVVSEHTATNNDARNGGSAATGSCAVVGTSGSFFKVSCVKLNGLQANMAFDFIAVGPR